MMTESMASSLHSTFAKTLVVGASVSAAFVDRNPTKRFLRSLGLLGGSMTHAQGGAPGARVLSSLKRSVLDQVTAVIALDLLFWDSVIGLGDPREAKAFLKGFFKELRARGLPILIGRVPGFHALQIYRDELNEAIENEVRAHREAGFAAVVVPLDQLFERANEDEGVHIDGRHHRLEDLIPDGLHPGPIAAEYIARELGNCAALLAARTRSA